MKLSGDGKQTLSIAPGGLAGWVLERLRLTRRAQPRLALLERIALAPRQSLALVEAEGRRFLVATSPEGAPAFYALDEELKTQKSGRLTRSTGPIRSVSLPVARPAADKSASISRVSW